MGRNNMCSEKGKKIKLFGVTISSTDTTDSFNHGRKIKKGNPWTEDEHRLFLRGLKIHGKGRWTKISKDCLPSRTPHQIASHAQKYFIRLSETNDRRRRNKPSVFEINLENTSPEEFSEENSSTVSSEHAIVLFKNQEHDDNTVALENREHGQDHQVTASAQAVTPIAAIATATSQYPSSLIPSYSMVQVSAVGGTGVVLPVTWVQMYNGINYGTLVQQPLYGFHHTAI